MAPLIDVVFLLLTFFVFSLVLLSRVSVVDLDLPTLGSGGQGEAPQAVVVAVDNEGMVFVDGQPVGPASGQGEPLAETTRQALVDAVTRSAGAEGQDPDSPAIIRLEVDERGVSGAMLRVLDALRTQGYTAVELIGRPGETAPTPNSDP
jgi:biopolymer transport protein ExbD